MTLNAREIDELLAKLPAYRRGELSPIEAHRITELLRDDPIFAIAAQREEAIVEAISTMSSVALPRNLVARSVKKAVGNSANASWFSIDSLLVALGVGIGCAGSAQFLQGKVNLMPSIGEWIGSMAGVAVDGTLSSLLGGAALVSLGIVVGGVLWAVRLIRQQ